MGCFQHPGHQDYEFLKADGSVFIGIQVLEYFVNGRLIFGVLGEEKAGSVSVTVQRMGNLNQYAIVLCRTEQGTATSSSRVGSQPGQQDYVEYAGQVGGHGGL